jgi:hypothetical protein
MSVNQPVRALQSVRTTCAITHAFLACCLMALTASAVAQDYEPVDYLGHNTAISVANGQIGITVPDSINLGDFLIAQIAFTGGSSVNITDVPEDWQLLVREDRENALGHAVFYQIVGNPGTIPAPGTAFQWVFDQDISAIGAITRYSGVDFNNPVQAIASEHGNSTAMKVPGVDVPDPGNVINLYAIGAVADVRKPGSTTLRYNVNNPDPVTVALRDYRVDDAPTSTGNDVVLGFADGSPPWITHTVAVRARVGSLTDPFNSLISADPVEITADGASTSTITVQARDSDGNNIETGGANVIIETDAGTLLGSVVDNGDGTYTQQLQSSTTADTATVTGTIYGFDIDGSATVNFVAGEADAQGSTISAADSQLPADGASSTAITVQARDEFGNPIAAASLPVTLSTTLGSLGDDTGVTDSDGRFQTSLTSSVTTGIAQITGTLDNVSIGNTASVEFVDSNIDPLESTITAAASQLTANGTDSTTVTVQLRDASGAEVEKAGVDVQVFADFGSLAPASGQTNASGQFSTTLTAPTTAGIDTISGRVLGDDIGNTAQVEYVAGAATRLRFAQQPADGQAGVPFSTSIEIVDANGNRVESASNSIAVQLTQPGDATLSGTLTVSAVNGLASFSDLSIDLVGDYSLTANTSGLTAAVSDSFRIDAGDVSGTNSEISADPGEVIANGASSATITVQAQDAFGNLASESGLAVTVSTTLGTLADTSGATDANGQFITTLTSSATGTATVSGTLGGDAISNTATVNFVDAVVDASSSSIEAADDELEADGVSSTAITVQVRDADGEPMAESGLPVTLSTTLGTLSDTSGTTDANGQFITTLTSETAVGTAEITGTLDGNAIGNTASVVFVLTTGDTASAMVFEIQPANSVQDFPIRGPLTVGFVDELGDPVTDDANITIEILSGPVGATLGGTTTLMSEDGFAIFSDLRLDMLGQYQLRATSGTMAPIDSNAFLVREDRLLHDRFEGQE